MTIIEIQNEIIEEFRELADWMDKYSLLIEWGNQLDDFDDTYRVEQNLIEGCQSNVWLHAWMEDGKVRYSADSNAIIVKGIVSLLIRVLDNHTPDEILESDLYFIDKIGLKTHLTPTRSNGLVALVKQMSLYAKVFKLKIEN